MRAEQDKVLLTDDQIKTEFKKKSTWLVACTFASVGRSLLLSAHYD